MKKTVFAVLAAMFFSAAAAFAGPPVNLSRIELLGRHLYKDKNLSYNGTQSCQVCHHPFAGFADRRNAINPETSVVSIGADGVSKGGRNAPTAAYAGYSPMLGLYDDEWVGGLFWDGRADGTVLGDPLAEQAEGPPLNPIEMAMPDKESVVAVIETSTYSSLFLSVFGPNAFDNVNAAYDNFARAVAAYERSREVTAFSSKFDVAKSQFTAAENRGMALFKTNCASCHSVQAGFGAPSALFTNYGYKNIGVPANPLVPLPGPDLGLGVTVDDSGQDGKFKVPTLRNIALSAPYTHNGSFATLTEMVSFINDRSGNTPELNRNLDQTVGHLNLSGNDVNDLVAFLMTLTDGY
jgi:cytochrome c peroxidase